MSGYLKSYVAAAMEKDPAATSKIMVLFTYPGERRLCGIVPQTGVTDTK